MIATFHCRDTESLFHGQRVARFANIAAVAIRKLQMLHAARNVDDLRAPPNNRLEALKGDRKGQYSIRERPVAYLLSFCERQCEPG